MQRLSSVLVLLTVNFVSTYIHKESKMCLCREKVLDNTKTNKTLCSTWCQSNVEHVVIDAGRGLIHVNISHSPHFCTFDSFDIDLDVAEQTCTKDNNFIKHSERTVSYLINSEQCSTCVQNIELHFDYVYTGCYRLTLTPRIGRVSRPSCTTKPFHVATEYNKSMILVPQVNIEPFDSSSRIKIILENGDHSNLAHLVITLQNSTKHQISCCPVSQIDWRSNIKPSSGVIDVEKKYWTDDCYNNKCSCRWLNETLSCELKNLDAGTYKPFFHVKDTRCEYGTVWHDPYRESDICEWTSKDNITITLYDGGNINETLSEDYLKPWVIVTSSCFLFLTISVILFTVLKRFNKIHLTKKHLPMETTYNKSQEIIVTEKVKILLLYPRDCQPFMDTMTELRNCLNLIKPFQVIDPLEDDLYDEVAINVDTWGRLLTSDPETKVILAASKCSLMFEESLVASASRSERFEYRDKQTFDNIFRSLLNQLFREKFPYKKIYVIRLDCNQVEKLHFNHLVDNRNYTLPGCFELLINHILELPAEKSICVEIDNQCLNLNNLTSRLEESIRKYNLFLSNQPYYLDELLVRKQT